MNIQNSLRRLGVSIAVAAMVFAFGAFLTIGHASVARAATCSAFEQKESAVIYAMDGSGTNLGTVSIWANSCNQAYAQVTCNISTGAASILINSQGVVSTNFCAKGQSITSPVTSYSTDQQIRVLGDIGSNGYFSNDNPSTTGSAQISITF
jgi:hypothetical protein